MNFRNVRLKGVVSKRAGAVAVAGLMGVGGVSLATSTPAVETIRTEVRDVFVPGPAAEVKTERGWDLANIDHDRVDYWIDRFRSDPDMREKFEGFVRRSGWYGEMIRTKLRERTKCTTTFGYGPRYLHSTGQYHKGGPANGLFIQLYQPPGEDVEIPEAGYSFGHLMNAQALGDMQTLRSHGLQVVRVEVDGPDAVRRLF